MAIRGGRIYVLPFFIGRANGKEKRDPE